MNKKNQFKLKKPSNFERDIEFLVSHAIIHSDKWDERLKFIDSTNFSKAVKDEAEKRIEEVHEKLDKERKEA